MATIWRIEEEIIDWWLPQWGRLGYDYSGYGV
ncbi:MAG: hypothetical protein KatS3mg016_2200 [Fimbriimonadales bacterium]|nr:MAG: hypothetical protein KatS3mg016_2200 [Fimbriimonadales bacterium]GIV07724.1 MAG: hypothetical protein KatS3mg017_0926 [Fimbriimonadales bacterium]